jgi:hypothetical protein
VKASRRKRSTSELSNKPFGTRPPSRPKVSLKVTSSGRESTSFQPSNRMRGTAAARLKYSWSAGRRKASGRNFTSSGVPVMKMRHMSAGVMRLASPAARKAPELTPT